MRIRFSDRTVVTDAGRIARILADSFGEQITSCETLADLRRLITTPKYRAFLKIAKKSFPDIAREIISLTTDVAYAFQLSEKPKKARKKRSLKRSKKKKITNKTK